MVTPGANKCRRYLGPALAEFYGRILGGLGFRVSGKELKP